MFIKSRAQLINTEHVVLASWGHDATGGEG